MASHRPDPDDPTKSARRTRAPLVAAALLLAATPALAQDTPLANIKIGAGTRASGVRTVPQEGDATDKFLLDSVRLYVSGPVTDTITFTVNTEYNGVLNDVQVLDAIAQFGFSDRFNIWVGRFLPPSDRANLYGPYYSHHWGVYTDGVQDGYPFVFQGRDNGAMYWGQFGKVKVSAGAFDGASATSSDTLIGAGRVQVDFWDPEPGYYLNGTFYGDKNILALGVAGQTQGSDRSAYSVDFLLERRVGEGGAYSLEAEWARYDGLGGYQPQYVVNDGGYVLASYLFPQLVGVGRFEVLGKYAHARFRDGLRPVDANFDQDTTELNLAYVIRQFNSRVVLFYKDTRFDAVQPDAKQVGIGIQLQM